MSTLNEKQIELIKKMGINRLDTMEELTADEFVVLGELITLNIVEKTRGHLGWSTWRVANFYDLMDELNAIIEAPAADEIAAPTDATLGDCLYEQDGMVHGDSDLNAKEISMMIDMRNHVCLVFTDETEKMERGNKLLTMGLCFQSHIDDGELGGQPLIEFILTLAGEDAIAALTPPVIEAPEILTEVAPLPTANMYANTIAAKDEHIDRLWVIMDKLIKTQISDMSPMECMTRLMELKRMALQEKK